VHFDDDDVVEGLVGKHEAVKAIVAEQVDVLELA